MISNYINFTKDTIWEKVTNRIVHNYEGISLKSIWFIVNNDLIELKKELKFIIDIEKSDNN